MKKNNFSSQSSRQKEESPRNSRSSKYKEKSSSSETSKKPFTAKKTYEKNFMPPVADIPFESVLERKYGSHGIQKLVQESAKKISEMLSTNAQPVSATTAVKTGIQPNNKPIPTRGFALAKFRAEQEQKPQIVNQQATKSVEIPNVVQHTTPSGIKLDEWQHEAVQALLAGKHVIVDAPTSAGKTRVIEALLDYRMKEGGKLIYTSPVKSLSNDKYREFTEKYGRENVGINTGDFKENLSAPIILATLETYRNSLLGIEPDMRRRVVVYDEYHYLQDESRGSAWEESLILTPKGSQLILLSASVPNCEDFASWITDLTGKQTAVVRVAKRPVPLVHVVHTKYGWILCDLLNLQQNELQELGKLAYYIKKRQPRFRGKDAYKDHVEPVSLALDLNLGPIVVYASRRGDVEGVALSFARYFKKEHLQEQNTKLLERIKTLSGWEYVPPELQKLVLRYGIAYHHSGMIPPSRVAIESLLKEGLLRVCCGTMGISLGVNFAVRSAYITDESRPSENGEVQYTNTEIMQMLGRAGRRGHDTQGFSLWFSLGRYASQRPRAREACKSSLKFDPTTIIGILGQHQNIEYLFDFYKKSFFMRNSGDKLSVKSNSSINKIVDHLQTVGALNGAVPSEMGNIARHFPQAGGLIIANWLAEGVLNNQTFFDYLQAMATFGSAHFKEIPQTHADMNFLNSLNLPSLIEKYYPYSLFPELYDEVKVRRYNEETTVVPVFREFNFGAASIVKHWLNPKTQWSDLVAEHSSKYFSDGDCMNVLFRFATFLQSCARLDELEPAIAAQAKRLWKTLMREPLDARNRMLIEEASEFENIPIPSESAE
ncbi:MAG: DEAD/DEAH box helicase [Bdellovibrionota bacterium]